MLEKYLLITLLTFDYKRSQEDFADELGTTATYVSNLENAKRMQELIILVILRVLLMFH